MRKCFFSLLFSGFCFMAFSQGNSQDSLWIRENYYKMERSVPMRDGVKLFTSMYIPKDTTEQHPILMTRTPYSCAPYGEGKWKDFTASYIRYYLREGYIVVTQDVRGRWMSEGQFVDVRPFNKDKKSTADVDEASDTYDAIDWMVKNIPCNNGKVGIFDLYKAIRQQSPSTSSHLVMGPWYHGQWASNDGTHLGNVQFGSNTSWWFQNNIQMPFFDYYLKGKGAAPNLAAATIFFSGENTWRKMGQWPPAAAKDLSYFLQPDGGLSTSLPGVKNNFSEYISDPAHPVPYTEDVHFHRTREYMTDDQRFASRRRDVLTFQTPVLQEDLTLAGPVVADLKVSISSTDADFVVKLIDVFPDDFMYGNEPPAPVRGHDQPAGYPMGGYQMLVHGEVMRGRFRESFERPVAFRPGKVETVRFAVPDVAHTFKRGHRVMVQVQSSWFPLVDRNPRQFVDIYTCSDSDFRKATIHVYHDSEHPSQLILPVLK